MDEIRKQLASLMESVDVDISSTDTFLDPKICKYYLCGLCPHDLFQNTKQYLGACPNIHSKQLREKYAETCKRINYGFEQQTYDFVKKLIDECDRRIQRHTARGRCDTQDKASESIEASAQKLIDELEIRIKQNLEQAENLGNSGDIDSCIKIMEEVQELQKKKKMIQDEKNSKVEETRNMWFQKLKPCNVCGALLSEKESDATRLKDHYTGRIHIGFQDMRSFLENLQQYIQYVAPLLPKANKRDTILRSRHNGDIERKELELSSKKSSEELSTPKFSSSSASPASPSASKSISQHSVKKNVDNSRFQKRSSSLTDKSPDRCHKSKMSKDMEKRICSHQRKKKWRSYSRDKSVRYRSYSRRSAMLSPDLSYKRRYSSRHSQSMHHNVPNTRRYRYSPASRLPSSYYSSRYHRRIDSPSYYYYYSPRRHQSRYLCTTHHDRHYCSSSLCCHSHSRNNSLSNDVRKESRNRRNLSGKVNSRNVSRPKNRKRQKTSSKHSCTASSKSPCESKSKLRGSRRVSPEFKNSDSSICKNSHSTNSYTHKKNYHPNNVILKRENPQSKLDTPIAVDEIINETEEGEIVD